MGNMRHVLMCCESHRESKAGDANEGRTLEGVSDALERADLCERAASMVYDERHIGKMR